MKLPEKKVILITGTRKGIGRYLAEYYCGRGNHVIGCSRQPAKIEAPGYYHYCLDVCNERKVKEMFTEIQKKFKRLDVLINNAGIASMNHIFLTPLETVRRIIETNFIGTFLFCREGGKLMQINKWGRIINFTTVASPLNLEGEAIYASSKEGIKKLTQVVARELSPFGITVNNIGPTPVKTDLIRGVPQEKIDSLINLQAIRRMGTFADISNVINFFINEESCFITGQTIYLGGILP
ncbi:SDR family NAD(P)-dependent oxidoreductase [Candidatus Riflebacteria bacterium]